MIWLSEEQAAIIAAALAAKTDTALVPADQCEHRFRVRWKQDRSVCLVCRAIIDGPAEFGISISGPLTEGQTR